MRRAHGWGRAARASAYWTTRVPRRWRSDLVVDSSSGLGVRRLHRRSRWTRRRSPLRPAGLDVLLLDPTTMADVPADIERVGRQIGRAIAAADLVAALECRLATVRRCVKPGRRRLRVLALEWLDPPPPRRLPAATGCSR